MKITVHGSGYVGLVTGACFAHMGNDVLCVDVNKDRVARLKQGEIPIHEPGLPALVQEGIRTGCLRFTDDPAAGVEHGTIQFIAVGTPPGEDGSADLKYVLAVADSIAAHMDGDRIVVDKSTVPVGTADKVRARIASGLQKRGASHWFDVVSNPEFLKEGSAVKCGQELGVIEVGKDLKPVAPSGQVVSAVAEAKTGKVIWSRDFKKDYGIAAPLWGFAGHPLLDGNRLICLVGGEGSVAVAFDKETGKATFAIVQAEDELAAIGRGPVGGYANAFRPVPKDSIKASPVVRQCVGSWSFCSGWMVRR